MAAEITLGDNYELDEDSNGDLIIRHTPSGDVIKYDSANNGFVGDAFNSVTTEDATITEQFDLSKEDSNPFAVRSFERSGEMRMADAPGFDNPILTSADSSITSTSVVGLADPFWVEEDGTIYVFAEALTSGSEFFIELFQGESPTQLTSQGKLFGDPDEVQSYPMVQKTPADGWIMTPTSKSDNVEIYQANSFPADWPTSPTETAIDITASLSDPTFQYVPNQNRWYLFVVDDSGGSGNFKTKLYYADQGESILGRSWTEHSTSPIHDQSNTPEAGKLAGRPIHYGNGVMDVPYQSTRTSLTNVTMFRVTDLTTSSFADHELPTSPVYQAEQGGWSANRTHHMDFMAGGVAGKPLAIVDGADAAGKSNWVLGLATPTGRPVAGARGVLTSDQTINDATNETVAFDDVAAGYLWNFDQTNNHFEVREGGRYQIGANIELDGVADNDLPMPVTMKVEDSSGNVVARSFHIMRQDTGGTSNKGVFALNPVSVNVSGGETLELVLFINNPNNNNMNLNSRNTQTYFDVQRLA